MRNVHTAVFLLLFMWTDAARLETYNVAANSISVSGISSGAAMATQMHVIHSATIMGAGIIAGVPFACAGGNIAAVSTCMLTPATESVLTFVTLTSSGVWLGNVDATSHMQNDKVYIFAGTDDTVVYPGNGPKIRQFYEHFIHNSNNINTEFSLHSQHCMPTDNYGGPCGVLSTASGYLNNCGYNAAYELLNHIYGGHLHKPLANTTLHGQLMTFDQSEFFKLAAPVAYSMDSTGYVYVPSGCLRKYNACKLHVALHGCGMGRKMIGDKYVSHAGYNEVGELNNIIILYPQATPTPVNPTGCWDWWGYTGYLYATNKGFQITGLQRMIQRVSGQ